jgi:hypothetical protein
MMGDTMPCIQKGVYKRSSHNLNARETQNYSIVEYLAQTPCAMFALEVLQSFPSKQNALLSSLGASESSNSLSIMFDTSNVKPLLPYHVTFHIVVVYTMKSFLKNMFSHCCG